MSDLWFTVARWLILGAVALALIGIPVVYHNRKVVESFENGKQVGLAELEAKLAEASQKDAEEAEARVREEGRKAQEALARAEAAERRTNYLSKKLKDALNENPLPAGCQLNESPTSILRSFADGNFESAEREGNALSGKLNPQMSGFFTLPGRQDLNTATTS